MEIRVNDKQKLLRSEAVLKARSRVNAEFAKFSDYVKSVEISIVDVNGPRGGVDKECRVLVKLKKINDVAVSVRDETLSKAVSSGIDRASRSVGRSIDRKTRAGENRFSRLKLE